MSTQLIDELPDWLDKEAWIAFKDMRKAKGKRCPFTPAAEKRLLWNLDMLRAKGNDPTAMLWQSTVAGWSDIYPVKHQQGQLATVQNFDTAKSNQWLQEHAKHMSTPTDEEKAKQAIARMGELRKQLRGRA